MLSLCNQVALKVDVVGVCSWFHLSIIKGNVKAQSVKMESGAVLEGFCSLTSYASLDIDNVFE